MGELREVLAEFGPIKSLKRWTDGVLLKEGDAAQDRLASANIAVNNALDVEYYKAYAYAPKESIQWMVEEAHFESVGHGYGIVLGQLVGLIAGAIDENFAALPKRQLWHKELLRLRDERYEGFYWGSTVRVPPVGLRAIYEGQAHFIQLDFLDRALDDQLTCEEWRQKGMLHGFYVEAFEVFMRLSDAAWPESVSDPLVSLFLLVCDLAINPTRGIQLDIESFEDLIPDVDVGTRFTQLCFAVRELPHLKSAITELSREEYLDVSEQLTERAGFDHPMAGLEAVTDWLKTAPGLPALMEEHLTFEFSKRNLPVRVFLSHFVSFCIDKRARPEYFCWPSAFMVGSRAGKDVLELWLRHLSLFSDRGDKTGVYPRKWRTRSEDAVRGRRSIASMERLSSMT
jgi:hypothetical protein